jgi:protein SCO1
VLPENWCLTQMTKKPRTLPQIPKAFVVSAAVCSVALAGFVGFGLYQQQNQIIKVTLPDSCKSRAFAEIGGPFSLVNQDNVAVTEKTFLGKPALIYFGFTYCPDICPMALQTMRLSLEAAQQNGGKKINEIQPILISFDPERDTPASLKTYIASNGFPTGLTGLTGSVAQVTAAAKAYKVGFRKSVPEGSPAKDYVMDHTSIMYLLGKDGKLRTFFSDQTDPDAIGKCIAQLSKSGL